jgi:hypothetical protein
MGYKDIPVNHCHHVLARPQVADGGTATNMRMAAKVMNEQSQTANKRWSSSGVGQLFTTPHNKNWLCYETYTGASDLD